MADPVRVHDWLFDEADRVWHCAACSKPVTGRGPTRPPPDGVCAGESAFRKAERPWGRFQEDGGGLDEVVMTEGMAHLERMDTGAWFLGLYPKDGPSIIVNLWAGSGPRMVAGALEEEG